MSTLLVSLNQNLHCFQWRNFPPFVSNKVSLLQTELGPLSHCGLTLPGQNLCTTAQDLGLGTETHISQNDTCQKNGHLGDSSSWSSTVELPPINKLRCEWGLRSQDSQFRLELE